MKSRISIGWLILILFSSLLFFFLMTVAFISTIQGFQNHKKFDFNSDSIALVGLIFSFFYIFYAFNSFRSIRLNSNEIIITGILRKRRFEWSEVVSVDLFKAKRTNILAFDYALVINLENNRDIRIWNNNYRNINELRCRILEHHSSRIIV